MPNFFTTGLWNVKTAEKPYLIRKSLNALRVCILTVRCFIRNNCALRASALTFYTLLSIIPVLALAFAIAKGFGLETKLENSLYTTLADQPEAAKKIVLFATNALDGAKGGVIAGFGAVMLLYTTIRLLMQIEQSFNDIWGVRQGRTIVRKISDYLSLVLLCPILVAVSGSMTAFAAAQLAGISDVFPFLHDSTPHGVLLAASRALPFAATWLLFSFIYLFVPNTKVKAVPALFGGLVAGLLYYVAQGAYIAAQFVVAKYNAVYGGFAALPLFLIWLQVSWTIVLFGSEIVYAVQNVSNYEGFPGEDAPKGLFRDIHAFRIMRLCSINFEHGLEPLTDLELSRRLEIPIRAARVVLDDLVAAKLLVPVTPPDGSSAYQVSMPVDRITPVAVLRSLQEKDGEPTEGADIGVRELLKRLWGGAAGLSENAPLHKQIF